MKRLRIAIDDLVGMAGAEHRVARQLPEGLLLRDVEDPARLTFLASADVERAWREGALVVRPAAAAPGSRQEERARFRRALCEEFLVLKAERPAGRSAAAVDEALRDAWTRILQRLSRSVGASERIWIWPRPCRRTFLRWLASYDGTLGSLMDGRARVGKPRFPRVDATALALAREVAAFRLTRGMPVAAAYRILRYEAHRHTAAGAPMTVPSFSTFRAIVHDVELRLLPSGSGGSIRPPAPAVTTI